MTDYHFSSTGNDATGNGTESFPWKTLEKLNGLTTSSGDSILLNKGDHFYRTNSYLGIVIPGDGVTVSSYGTGAKPRVLAGSLFQVNHATEASYDSDGYGRDPIYRGMHLNSKFGAWTNNVPDGWSITNTGTGVEDTADYPPGGSGVSCQLIYGASGGRLNGGTIYFPHDQLFEISFWCKSDGSASATVDFYAASGGLANTKTGDTYKTWTGYQAIGDLAIATTDTTWTKKTAKIQADGSSRTGAIRFINNAGTAGHWIKIADLRIRPLWVNYSGDIWSTGYDGTNTVAGGWVMKDEQITAQAANADAVSAITNFFETAINSHTSILYVYSPEGDPSGGSYTGGEIWRFGATTSQAIDLNGKSNVILDGLEIYAGYYSVKGIAPNFEMKNCDVTFGSTALMLGDTAGFDVHHNNFRCFDWCINFRRGISGGIFRYNTIDNCAVNTLGEGGAIGLTGESDSFGFTGSKITGLIIENNTITDVKYGFLLFGNSATTYQVTANTIRRNKISDFSLAGIWVAGASSTTATTANDIYGNRIFAPKAGTTYGLRTYAYGDNNWVHNGISGCTYNISAEQNITASTYRNNLTVNAQSQEVYVAGSMNSLVFDYNRYWQDGAAKFKLGATNTYDFAGWKGANGGQDTHSAVTDPKISADPVVNAEDFRIASDSSCMDAAVAVTPAAAQYQDGETNYVVGNPDIGPLWYIPIGPSERRSSFVMI